LNRYLGKWEVNAAAVTLVAEVVSVGVDAQEADQAVQLSNTVLWCKTADAAAAAADAAAAGQHDTQQERPAENIVQLSTTMLTQATC
jgi:hypothetical protein